MRDDRLSGAGGFFPRTVVARSYADERIARSSVETGQPYRDVQPGIYGHSSGWISRQSLVIGIAAKIN
jgi:hypothetical protein